MVYICINIIFYTERERNSNLDNLDDANMNKHPTSNTAVRVIETKHKRNKKSDQLILAKIKLIKFRIHRK